MSRPQWITLATVVLQVIAVVTASLGHQVNITSASVVKLQWNSIGDAPKFVKKLSACSCETDVGRVDLSPLDSKDPSNPRFSVQSGLDTYLYNPCSSINKDTCTDAAMCDKYSSTGYTAVIGKQDTAAFSNGPDGSLVIQYTNGFFSGTVTLKCDHSAVAEFTVQTAYNPYKFTLTSKYACPHSGNGGGLSVGSILLIVAIVLLVVYLIGGVIFLSCFRQATGVDMIPNASFWKEVPSLIRDGTRYAVSTVTNSKVPQKGGYEEMST